MEEALIKRVLPHSLEAEQSVIGSMLMDREAVIAASEIITGSDFYQQQYGIMFDAMVELFNEGKPVDLVTLQDRLKEKDVPPEVSSLDFVRDIMTMVPTSANIKSYANIVSEKAVLRRLIKTTEEIAGACYAGKEPLENILADTEIAASEIITGSDFYQQQYGIMFDAMVELFNEGKPVDLVTLQDRLKEKDVPPEVSSLDFVRDIMTMVPTSANIKSYANIVSEKAVLRRLIKTTEEIAGACYAGKEPLENILADTEKSVFDLLQNKGGQEFVPIKQVAINVLEKIEDAYRNQGTVTGIPSGFIDLDYKLSGFQPSDFILIAARPSMGKTAFVLNVVDYVSVRKNLPCMVFSLEMSKEQLVNRMLSMESNVDSQKLRTGTLTDADWDAVVEGIGVIGNSKLIIDDTPGISITELRSKCRKMKLEHGLSLVIIDYLQLMSGSKKGGNDNRQQEISEISRSLKAIARELHAPVIALSQLSRACETRTDHRPMLSDLRESGAIEQDADVVMFLYRDDYYNKDTEHPNEAEVIIAKQRNGPIGTVNLIWKPEYTKFVNAARPQGGNSEG